MLFYTCHTNLSQIAPNLRTKCIKSQMRKSYSRTAKCPNTSRNQHYKVAYISKAFCNLQNGEHSRNLSLAPSGHNRFTIAVFFLVGIFSSKVSPCWKLLNKAPLTTLLILPLQQQLKLIILTPGPFVLDQLSSLYVVLLGRIPFKMIPGSFHLEMPKPMFTIVNVVYYTFKGIIYAS